MSSNIFQKLKEQKTNAKPEEPAPVKSKNPFSRKNKLENNDHSASPPKAKRNSNPFARRAEQQRVSPPVPAATGGGVSKEAADPSDVAPPPPSISAEEFTHESQPEAYSDKHVRALKDALENLAGAFQFPEQIPDAIRLVGNQIREHPALCKIMAPEDWGLMVRGMRESYAVVIQKKDDRRGKKAEKAADEAEADKILAELGL